jgi:hypothetical protein
MAVRVKYLLSFDVLDMFNEYHIIIVSLICKKSHYMHFAQNQSASGSCED